MKAPQQSSIGEGKESLQPALQILKETSEKYNSLGREAKEFEQKQDFESRMQKLVERAQLLVDLPSRLSDMLEDIDPEERRQIENQTYQYSVLAQQALENDTSGFTLSVLLTSQGQKKGDNNALENLIASLEE